MEIFGSKRRKFLVGFKRIMICGIIWETLYYMEYVFIISVSIWEKQKVSFMYLTPTDSSLLNCHSHWYWCAEIWAQIKKEANIETW